MSGAGDMDSRARPPRSPASAAIPMPGERPRGAGANTGLTSHFPGNVCGKAGRIPPVDLKYFGLSKNPEKTYHAIP